MTIIEIIAKSNSGKSQSIILAARKTFIEGATLVAKYYRQTNVDVVEVYQIKTSKGDKYVAYASAGDIKEVVNENFEALEMFKDVAHIDERRFQDYKNKNGKYWNMPKSRMPMYDNMEETLKAIKDDFTIDVIVAACHPYNAIGESETLDAIKDYAKKHGYKEKPMFISTIVETENWINTIAQKIVNNANTIKDLVQKIIQD